MQIAAIPSSGSRALLKAILRVHVYLSLELTFVHSKNINMFLMLVNRIWLCVNRTQAFV